LTVGNDGVPQRKDPFEVCAIRAIKTSINIDWKRTIKADNRAMIDDGFVCDRGRGGDERISKTNASAIGLDIAIGKRHAGILNAIRQGAIVIINRNPPKALDRAIGD